MGILIACTLITNTPYAEGKTKAAETEKILVSESDIFLKDNRGLNSLNSLGIKNKYKVFDAVKDKNSYTFKYGANKYSIVEEDARNIKEIEFQESKEIKEYKERPSNESNFEMMPPRYSMHPILENAIEEFRIVNKGFTDFDSQMKNLYKVAYNMNLAYGEGGRDQGDLSSGTTQCNGFTWIASKILDETNLGYRFILRSPIYEINEQTGEKENKFHNYYHIYLEVYEPEENRWIRMENTLLEKRSIGSFKGDTIEEKTSNMLKDIKRPREGLLDMMYISVPKGKSVKPCMDIYISEIYQNGKIIDKTCYKIISKSYKNSILLNKDEYLKLSKKYRI